MDRLADLSPVAFARFIPELTVTTDPAKVIPLRWQKLGQTLLYPDHGIAIDVMVYTAPEIESIAPVAFYSVVSNSQYARWSW